ncbi:MAG TPA: tRNA (adenosine(37)-N6)-dimethylallyltransferase MiaA [Gelidibacter sp.]|uniref:tRNA (adenosine(37)-N6)-dimethylallyltransferase MiaA n=1 Tax=Gelidibacter sp. TaxID=2018083 RepID=UPI002D0E360E|nr:tRNA (adenosine(37)-N6)-dimethylallyltransferase MiaA [Gelidibacter sp.]HXK00213.1 tRNA (adenosine(37)-N6)-dimethylallyltransferase MiaA [Gelidibacter sp.]
MTNQKHLISIVGPTGIGKTSLSIALAQHFNTEIISADSRQFYKEMQIGTAAPTPEELNAAPHHFIHHKSVLDTYNVGDFEKDALTLLNQLFVNHNVVIMVGGSGLYVDAVTKGLDDFPQIDPTVRETLNDELTNKGLEHLQNQLKTLDTIAFNQIAMDNPHRVIRALEICIGSGQPYSSFLNKPKPKRPFKTISIGLDADRPIIYERINTRVDQMMALGLLDEVKTLQHLQHQNALNTVGYSELFKVLNGEWTLDFAVSEIKKNSRRYAKRQLTWFKKNENILWFDYKTPLENITASIAKKLAEDSI